MPQPSSRRCDYVRPDGSKCKNHAARDSNRCRFHGSRTPKGIASPSYKHGRYSKYLPANLMERYEQALEDPEILNLTNDIAMIDARLSELVSRISAGETDRLWGIARGLVENIRLAQVAGSIPEVLRNIADLVAIIEKGDQDSQSWAEILSLMEAKRRLIESERKRRVEMQLMLSTDQAVTLMGLLVQTVREHVSDPEALRAISNEFIRLTEAGGRVGTQSRQLEQGEVLS